MKEPFKNIVDIRDQFKAFKNPNCSYSVSSRLISPETDILTYLALQFIYINISQISTVFGSVVNSSDFYGGRPYAPLRSLTESQVSILRERNINIALTLTNHFFTKEIYKKNIPFLERYHQEGNVIICTSDNLAREIRKNFPNYKIRASIIKNLNTSQKVERALDIYDDIVIPMDMNDDDEFLTGLSSKQRIMLFANAACAYACPSRICYRSISKYNQGREFKGRCMKKELGINDNSMYFFDVGKYREMGFSSFKLIPISLQNYSF